MRYDNDETPRWVRYCRTRYGLARAIPMTENEARPDGAKVLNRALPTWAIDALLIGMPEGASSRKVWGSLVRVSMAAQERGWTQTEFEAEVTKRERRKNAFGHRRLMQHRLWIQLVERSRDNRHAHKQLARAWDAGVENRMNLGLRTKSDLIADAIERAYIWSDRLTEGKDGLSDSEALVMSYVLAFVEKRQITRVTCPSREVAQFTGVPKSTVHRTLKALVAKGFLEQFSRGIWAKDPSIRKAAIYSLGDPLSLRYGGRGAPSVKADSWKRYVPERDSEEVMRSRERGICTWFHRGRPA